MPTPLPGGMVPSRGDPQFFLAESFHHFAFQTAKGPVGNPGNHVSHVSPQYAATGWRLRVSVAGTADISNI